MSTTESHNPSLFPIKILCWICNEPPFMFAMLHPVLLFPLLASIAHSVAALDFSGAKWIWTDKTSNFLEPPYITRDFRNDFLTPFFKDAVGAEILITADNNYTLYVNGRLIGQGNNWQRSERYCVGLASLHNVFAVAVYNQGPTPSPAGLISAINVTYSDGSSDKIVTDASWKAHDDIPNFQSTFDLLWPNAVVEANVGSSPFYTPALPPSPSTLSLNNSFWIWTNEVVGGGAPVGNRAFRKTIKSADGSLFTSGTVIIDVDNGYTLYINGNSVGQAHDYQHAQKWTFTLSKPTDTLVIAVNGYNDAGPAGLIAAIALDAVKFNCDNFIFLVSDTTWKFNRGVPSGFEQPGYDDSAWPTAISEGAYGVGPWGLIPVQ